MLICFPGPEITTAAERGNLRMGRVWVEIPSNHEVGELEPEIQVDRVLEGSPVFVLDQLRDSVREAPGKKALLFVHGFNVSFESAARRTGQLAFDLSIEEEDSKRRPRSSSRRSSLVGPVRVISWDTRSTRTTRNSLPFTWRSS